jgi:hypothetical protein
MRDPHPLCGRAISHILNVLNFEEVIAAADRAYLRPATFLSSIGNLCGVGALECASCFGELGVARLAISVLDHPARPFSQQAVQILGAHSYEPRTAGPAWNVFKKLLNRFAEPRAHVVPL